MLDPPLRIAVLWLGRVSLDTAGRTYLTELLGPLAAQPGLTVDAHLGDPEFAVASGCGVVFHRVPYRLGPAARILLEPLVAVRLRRSYDVLFAPFGNLPFGWRGPSVVAHHNVLAFGPLVREELSRLRAWWRPIALRSSLRRATRTLVVSAYLRRILCDAYPDLGQSSIEVVPYGVADRLGERGDREVDAAAPQLVAVSATWRYKRLDQAIEALADIGGGGARLVIAGPELGDERRRLGELAERLGVGERVVFAGNLSHTELATLYAASDVLLYLSEIESFGMPVLEAMRVGLPVVARQIPGVAEIGGEGPVWIGVEASRTEIAEAVASILRDPNRRRRHIAAGRARAACFTWERTAHLTAIALREAAGAARAQSPAQESVIPTSDGCDGR